MRNEEIETWLEKARQALLVEGFKDTIFQEQKPDQVFGLVKDVGDVWQMHVRGFRDGHLEAEIEISRWFLEHPNTSQPATKELREILERYQIPYSFRESPIAVIQSRTDPPGTLTDWRPFVIIRGIIAATMLAAYLLRRK